MFHLIDRFWEVINDLSVDIDWLVKNKNHMDKIQWKKTKAKGKMVVAFLEIVTLTKSFLGGLMSTLLYSKLNQNLFCIAILDVRNLEISANLFA